MTTQTGSHRLAQRWGRARHLFRETRAARGSAAAAVLLGRLLLLKIPLLIRHVWAARRTVAVRANIANSRTNAPNALHLAFAISGGLGDTLVIARFLRDLSAHIGGMQFDVFAANPSQAAWALKDVSGFRAVYHDISFNHALAEYDVAMRVNQSVVVYQDFIRWGSVRRNHNLTQVIDNLVRFRPKIDVFVDHHPWLDHFLARTAVFEGATRRDFLHVIAGLRYGGEHLPMAIDTSIVARLGLDVRQYITVHNGFDPGYIISAPRATKCYPHFGAVVTELKAALPNITFIQIGTTTSKRIPECDLILLNKTSLDAVAGLIGKASLHLDNEGGLVHLAASLGTRSAVVFGPTPSDYFGYPTNINIEPPVCGNCWYMTRTWMDACAKGHEAPLCMVQQDPHRVAEHVLRALLPEAPLITEPSQHLALVQPLTVAMSGEETAV